MAYRGLVLEIPLGVQGFTGSKNHTQMGPGHFSYTDNIVIDGRVLQKAGGAVKLNAASQGSAIRSGISWSPAIGIEYTVILRASGTVMRDIGSGTFPTTLRTGLVDTDSPPGHFVVAGGEVTGQDRKLFLFTALNQPQVTIGQASTMAAISGPAADWATDRPTFGVVHSHRLWAGGNANDPHRMYYSDPDDHQVFNVAPAGTLPIYPGDGGELVGGISFRGLLVLFKYPRGIYMVDTSDPDPINWVVTRLTDAVGGVNAHTIISIANDVMYLDPTGNFHLLSATNAFGDVETSSISKANDFNHFVRSGINRQVIKKAVAVWYESKQQAWIALASTSSTLNDLRVIVDLQDMQSGVRFFMSRRDTIVSMWNRPDTIGIPIPVTGDNTGFVRLMDRDAKNKDGASYESRFVTPNLDFKWVDQKLGSVGKSFQFLELISEPSGDWDLTVEVWCDDVLTSTVNFSMGAGGAALDTFVLDEDILVSDAIRSQRRRISGSGRRLRLVGYNSGLNQNIAIATCLVSFMPMNEDNRGQS